MTNISLDEVKILIVDDQEVMRNLLTSILEQEGYEVQSVSDGHTAVQRARKNKFHLFMVDIKMPGLNGIEVLKKIKEIDQDAQIVMITGYASLETAIEAIGNGASGYIEKPFDNIEYVINVVNRAVEKRRLIDENRRKIFELNALYKVSNEISNILDYPELFEVIMDSINQVIDCDSCASLLVSGGRADFVFKSPYHATLEFVQQVKSNLIEAFNVLVDVPIMEEDVDLKPKSIGHLPLREQCGSKVGEANRKPKASVTEGNSSEEDFLQTTPTLGDRNPRLKSVSDYFNVPLIIQEKPVGMINISSTKRDTFSEYDIRLLYTIANQAATAIDRLRAVVAAEKNKIETMVESMSDGVIMIDEKGELAIINPAARKMFAEFMPRNEVLKACPRAKRRDDFGLRLGIQIDDSIEKLDTIEDFGISEYLRVSLTEGKKQTQEIVIAPPQTPPMKGGEPSPQHTILQTNIAPVETPEGKKLGAVAVLRDVTREREIDRMKSDFISIVSHELRTPLANIKNAVSLIEIAGEVNDNQKEFLSIATQDSDRLTRLIEQLLDISRIESGRMELNIEMVCIGEIASASFESLKHRAEEKGISIINNIPEDLPNILADKDRLQQVFSNLIDNAIKFTDKGGEINIEAKYISEAEARLKSGIQSGIHEKKDDFVEVRVIDTGIGIAPKDQEKIFDKFQQIDTLYSPRKTGGVGLGLVITKKIIEEHHGRIWVESQLDKGSQFIFVLPRGRQEGKGAYGVQ